MRRTNIAIVVIAVLAVIGAGTGIGLAASAGAATRTTAVSATHTPTYVIADCSELQVKPSSYILACADGNAGLEHLDWTTWSAKLASGYGTFYENDCTPTCVDGHFHTYPALVVLWGSGAVKGHPADRRYTEITLIFTTSKRPSVVFYKNGKAHYTYPVTQTFAAPPQFT